MLLKFRLSAVLLTLMVVEVSPAEPIRFYDMTHLNALDLSDPGQARTAWDEAHLVAALQGIVNRDAPRLFVRFMPQPDDFWWNHLTSADEWLHGRDVEKVDSVDTLLKIFASRIKGLVVYSEQQWASSNLASTIAGVEDRLPLRHSDTDDSLYARVRKSSLPFTNDLLRIPTFTGTGLITGTETESTGSVKCDAYLWLKQHYLDTGRVSKEYLAFYIDQFWLTAPTKSAFSNATLSNHDFFISKRALFFDLHVWDEEAPVDDPGQTPGTDARTLRELLAGMVKHNAGAITHIGGFTPWAWKYTDHPGAGSQHGGVDTEWRYAQIISSYNGIMDADALGYSGMANASFYQHHPLEERYPQNTRPTLDDLRKEGLLLEDGSVAPDHAYACFYMGDYDSAAWFNYHTPLWWQDPAHGEQLCTWAFNPFLDRRAPHAMHFVRKRQSANDWFMFGDSGAGYLNPGELVEPRESGLPSGLDAWVRHNLAYARRYDLDITGFIIDGHAKAMGDAGMDAYLQFSPAGIVGQKMKRQGLWKDTMPYLRMRSDIYGAPEQAGSEIAGMVRGLRPEFLFFRTILQSPSWTRDTMAASVAAQPRLKWRDPYRFSLLLRQHERSK
ncbi:MAG: hypothetical protein RLZZ303_147 [Candidatus Hydrogenedentota bacterium]|jgi:hypothetical protein